MITAYGGPPMLDPSLGPIEISPPLHVPSGGYHQIKLPGSVEMSRWHSDTISLVLARGLSHVVGDVTGAGERKIIQRIEVFPQTADAPVLSELRGLAASIEVQLRVGEDLVYRCPLAGILTLDSALAQRLAVLEARLAAYETELTNKLSAVGGESPIALAIPDGNDSFMRIATPIDLDVGQRVEVSLVGLPSPSISRAVPCTLTIALHGHTQVLVKLDPTPTVQISPGFRLPGQGNPR